MFGIGGFELFIILLFGFLIFGPDKLPQIARTVGAAIGKFRKAQEEMNQVIKGEVLDPNAKSPSENRSSGRAKEERSDAQGQSAPRKETFAERKARYERQRQAEAERDRQEANRAAMRAKDGAAPVGAVDAKPAPKPRMTADELYGVAPSKPKPRAASDPTTAASGPTAAADASCAGPAQPGEATGGVEGGSASSGKEA